MTRCSRRIAAALVVLALGHGVSASAQVGKGAIVDTNTAAEKDLLALPHMTPAIVKGLMEKRPFTSVVELNAFLTSQSLTPAQLTELYGKTFIHVNLNTGTPGGDLADSRRRETHGARVCRVPPVENVGPVRQGDRQVRRAGGNRSPEAVQSSSPST